MARCGNRNYMDELHDIICAIEKTTPEPEVCNVRCPPLGCPKGPCIGMCCYRGACDACCVSQMPCCPPDPEPPSCCIPRGLSQMRQSCPNPCPTTTRHRLYPLPSMCPSDRRIATVDPCSTPQFRNSGRGPHGPRRPSTCN